MLKKPKRTQLAGGFVLLLALSVPIPNLIVPAWSLRLVDNAGVPQAGIQTVQTWRHPLFQPEFREEMRISDAGGHVAFPERKTSGNGFLYLYRVVDNLVHVGIVASFGPDVRVRADKGKNFSGNDFYLRGRPPPETVVIRRNGVCPALDLPA